ncbi:MAG: A24 family peptidase [Planctomycetaceae bacterium]|jgi:prepilin peptidase CpaA|nr:A24 family peptidase [bacterium]MDC0307782.1 A24 family peptidase [Planctomycetaceae bacterium]MDG2388024.1 A24 family peptidase [Planctomycetaceae bacterium]
MDLSPRAVCLLGLLLVATYTDLKDQKIYNETTYPGMLLGLILSAAFAGWPGVQHSLAGFLVCGTVMVVCFLLFDVGGGDVKLIAMMGAFLGVQEGIEAMLWTFILGSIMGIAILIWKFGIAHLMKKTIEHLWLVFRAKGWIKPTEEEREPLQRWLFLAPAALAAVMIVLSKSWLAERGILY